MRGHGYNLHGGRGGVHFVSDAEPLLRPASPARAARAVRVPGPEHHFNKAVNTTPHINRRKVKQTALEIAHQTRAQGFTRVGRTFLERIESKVRLCIANEVRSHPSKGKTLT
jgi:hypothetical protein